jgi:hypothetical protein
MLVPIAILAFFHDVPGWVSTLNSAHAFGFLGAAVALFVLGLWLKRGIVGASLEMSEGSTILGIVFLTAAIGFYIYGSWYGLASWFHFESLLLLAVGYGLLCLDTRFMRLTAPLLAMFAFLLPFPLVHGLPRPPEFPLYVPIVFVALFAVYLRTSPKSMLLPALVAGAGALYWLFPAYWLLACAPLLCLALLAPKRLRIHEQLPGGGPRPCALHGEPGTLALGFCSMCGRKSATERRAHLGVVGLAIVLLTIYALAVTQIPALSLNAGVPTNNLYSPRGVTSAPIPPTPAGWLVNSSTRLVEKGDAYAVKQVYVPSYHPETENYTLYYELSPGVTPITNSWTAMPGWNQSSAVSPALPPMQGRIITYVSHVSPHPILLVFVGSSQLYFSNGTTFEPLFVGVSVTREFQGTTVANATSEFTNDLQALFLPTLNSETYASSWTNYFFRVSQTATAVEGLLALVSSTGLIFWGTYRVELSDTKLDGFVTAASGVDDEDYSLLAGQMAAGRAYRTGNRIADMAGVGQDNKQGLRRIYHSLQNLERSGLIKRTLVETGPDLTLEWKTAV